MKTIAIIGKREIGRHENYYAAVEACNALAVELVSHENMNRIESVDGIIIPGGVDINPDLYQEENIDCRDINNELDQLEMEVIKHAILYKKPILGICRGHQILNVFFRGSLIQNVENAGIHEQKDGVDKVHTGRVSKDSFLYEVYGEEFISINSAHHQAVKKLGENLEAVQFSEDGIMEAFYHTQLPIMGVQWHPERMCLKNARPDTVDGLKLFDYFIHAKNIGYR